MKRLFMAGAAALAVVNSAGAAPPTTPYAIKDASGLTRTECTYADANSLFYVCHMNFGWNPTANGGAGGAQAWTMDANGGGLVTVEGTVAVGNAQEHSDLQALAASLSAPYLPSGASTSANQVIEVAGLAQLHADLTPSGGVPTAPSNAGQAHADATAISTAAAATTAQVLAAMNQAHTDAAAEISALGSGGSSGGLTNTQILSDALATASGQAIAHTDAQTAHTDAQAVAAAAATATGANGSTAPTSSSSTGFTNAAGNEVAVGPANPLPVLPGSPSNFLPNQVTLGTTSTLIVAARTGRVNVTVENTSTATEYVGPSGVTTSTGFPIPAGQALSIATTAALYGVATASSTAAEYETY